MRPENPDPEVSGGAGGAPDLEVPEGARDPMRDDVDGEEAMVPRVPNLPPEPSARQIAEHELTYRSWCRRCVASKGRPHAHSWKESCQKLASIMASLVVTEKMCCRSCVSSVGTVQLDAWKRQLLTGREASDYASSFLTAFIKSLGFKRILVRPDTERSLLSLIERVTCNLTGVELVLMTSPAGDHQANGLAEVGVREIKAQPRILRSQLEQRLGSRTDEKDPRCRGYHVMQRIVCPDTD